MKTLIVYEKSTGNVSFTQSITSVENGEVILEDTKQVKEAKERLKKLNEEVYEIKLKLLNDMVEG